MLKQIFIFIFIFLSINPCFAFKWENRETGEKPYGVAINDAIFVEDNVAKLSNKEKQAYLKNLYETGYVLKSHNDFIVVRKNKDYRYYEALYYDKDLNIIAANDNYDKAIIDNGSKFVRFHRICHIDLGKCGILDIKRNRFSGYKYDRDQIKDTFSGAPVVVVEGREVKVQPFVQIGNSIVRGSVYYPVLICRVCWLL